MTDEETSQEQFGDYKKKLGKQYMDGLISDIEYDDLLEAKKAELGLNLPLTEDEELECPSCGALITEYATECNICEIALEPISPMEIKTESDAVPIPADEFGLENPEPGTTCSNCGTEVLEIDTVCTMCGNILGGESEPAVEEHAVETFPEVAADIDDKSLSDTKVCSSCSAFVDNEVTECPICETPFDIIVPTESALELTETSDSLQSAPADTAMTSSEATDSQEANEPPTEDISEIGLICTGCGAILDKSSTECFICDLAVGESTASPEAADTVPEPEIPAEPEFVDAITSEIEDVPDDISTEVVPIEDDISEIENAELSNLEEPEDDQTPMAELSVEEAISSDEGVALENELDQESLDIPDDVDSLEFEIPEAEIVEEIVLREDEFICPSCSNIIQDDNDKCPECWTDLSLYVRCPACSLLTPSGEDTCRECFAPLGIPMEVTSEGYIPSEFDITPMDVEIPEEMEITEELREEISTLEIEEEQGKECLVCGAIFGSEDEVCPICFMEYGMEVDEPDMVIDSEWDVIGITEMASEYICPNCGDNVTGMDATDREVNETRWFYRGIFMIFTGIFFTSFSIWARGVSAESASLGMNPPPTDALLNIIGWFLVLIGFVFWLFSWKLHEMSVECQECGIEIKPDMANCINCGADFTDDEQYMEDEYPAEESYEEPAAVEMPVQEVYEDELELSDEFDESLSEEEVADQVPGEEFPEPTIPTDSQEPEEPISMLPLEIGTELPTEHEEHKQCSGCGIFVDLKESICPVCDTEFDVVDPSVPDEEIEIQSEEDELSGFGVEVEPDSDVIESEETPDEITVPEEGTDHVECPSCGADVEAGTASCPVCEYPLDS